VPIWHPLLAVPEVVLAVLVVLEPLLEQAAVTNARAAANATDMMSLPVVRTNLPFLGVSAVQGSVYWSSAGSMVSWFLGGRTIDRCPELSPLRTDQEHCEPVRPQGFPLTAGLRSEAESAPSRTTTNHRAMM
jgi:hypothetical protein